MNIFRRAPIFLLTLILIYVSQISFGQTNDINRAERELSSIYAKIFPFYYGNHDSLTYYSDLFASKFKSLIKNDPSTLSYKFKSLTDSNVCSVVTTKDGLFRIYSWDTWQGGTMHAFENIYQFKTDNKVYTTLLNNADGDMGTYFTDAFSLKANGKTYFLAVSGGSESSKDAYTTIGVYTISEDTLNDKVKLIKTKSGLTNSISLEYDFFSVADRPERPIRLIKYDEDKKIIKIPVVLENGKVTDRFIIYQFNGQYFERKSQ